MYHTLLANLYALNFVMEMFIVAHCFIT